MKKSAKWMVAAGGVLAVLAMTGAAGAQTTASSPLESLTKAKAVFEQACSVCHPVDRPLSKTFDKAGWEKTLDKMRANGGKFSDEDRAMIIAYLLTKNTFEAKCSACHGVDRPLGKSKSAADWLSTVQRMAGKKAGMMTETEIADIAAYLAIVRPVQK